MKITEAIILCGGLGTRIASVLPNIPKVLAPVAGHPFIQFVVDHLGEQGIQKIILATGYGHHFVDEYIATLRLKPNADKQPVFDFSEEEEALGTGGAIKLALEKTVAENVLVVNGDSLFKIDLPSLAAAHNASGALCTLALKPMENFERYGAVELGSGGKIISFQEKKFSNKGYINGGSFIVNRKIFTHHPLPAAFSFEKNYLETCYPEGRIRGVVQDEYFIDIGVPEDLAKARLELNT